MGSHVIRIMHFLPANFHLATPFHSRLESGTRQTDRQTDRQWPHYSTLWGWRHINKGPLGTPHDRQAVHDSIPAMQVNCCLLVI